MLLSRLWVNIKQGECNTIVFINRSCILPFAYTLKKEPFKLLDFFIYGLSKFFRGFRQKFGGQLWGREKIKAKN